MSAFWTENLLPLLSSAGGENALEQNLNNLFLFIILVGVVVLGFGQAKLGFLVFLVTVTIAVMYYSAIFRAQTAEFGPVAPLLSPLITDQYDPPQPPPLQPSAGSRYTPLQPPTTTSRYGPPQPLTTLNMHRMYDDSLVRSNRKMGPTRYELSHRCAGTYNINQPGLVMQATTRVPVSQSVMAFSYGQPPPNYFVSTTRNNYQTQLEIAQKLSRLRKNFTALNGNPYTELQQNDSHRNPKFCQHRFPCRCVCWSQACC